MCVCACVWWLVSGWQGVALKMRVGVIRGGMRDMISLSFLSASSHSALYALLLQHANVCVGNTSPCIISHSSSFMPLIHPPRGWL